MQSEAAEAVVPAVVVRGELNGLGVVRSLAQGGVPAIIVDTTLRHAAMWSRCGKRHLVDQLFGKPFVESLLRLQNELGARPVLILTDEMSVHTISEHRAELRPFYRFRMPSAEMVATLSNKASFHNFAQAHDLPVPRTIVLEQESGIANISDLGLPVIIKPADKHPVHLGLVERINCLDRAEDADAACRRMLRGAGTLVVQEWIEGPDSSIYFALFHCGAASRSLFFGRKIAVNPPGLGSTAVCVPAAEATDLLLPITEKFLEVTRYEGLGSLEFKWDSSARRFVIIEPTVGRTDWQEEIATLNGVNLALISYCHETGLPIPAEQPTGAAAWRESLFYLRQCAEVRERTYDGYWRAADPLPAIAFLIDRIARGGRRLLARPLLERRKPPFRRRRIA